MLSRFVYTYDSNGNRHSQEETRTHPATGTLAAPETTTYGYDALDRLTGVAYADGRAVLYRLDAVGNRTGEREAPSSAVSSLGPDAFDSLPAGQLSRDTSGTFNRADWLMHLADQLDNSQERQLSYDANGNLSTLVSSARTRVLSWDIRNTLTTVSDNNQEVGRYDYDSNLQRIWRRTASENVEYVLDDGFVLQEMDATRQTKRRYHYTQKGLAVSDSKNSTTTTRFLSSDALGSVSDTTSTMGEVTTARKYDAWGKHREETAPSAESFKLDYTGHQFDVETGLTYARARYYDGELGRFIGRDSHEGVVGDAPSLHRYAYAKNNPLSYTDPSGHDPDLTDFGKAVQGKIYSAELSQLSDEQLAGLLHETAFQYRGDSAAGKLQELLADREKLQKTVCDYTNCNTNSLDWTIERIKRALSSASNQTSEYLSGLPIVKKAAALENETEEVVEATKESIGETVKGATINAISSKQAAPLGDKFAKSMGEATEYETHLILKGAEEYGKGKLLEVAVAGGGAILEGLPKLGSAATLNELPESVLYRITKGGFGTPRNPRPPTVKEFNPRIYEVSAGELEGRIVDRLHPTNEIQRSGILKMNNDELTNFRIEDPISASGAKEGFHLTGGHHRTEEIIRRVNAGEMAPNTTIKILLHD